MLTLRELGAVGIKLLGVSYLARSVLAGFSLAAVRFSPAEFGSESAFFAAQALSAVGYPVAALLLLGTGDDLASRLFPSSPVPANLEARDVAVLGVGLVGLATAVSALPTLLEAAGTAIYYAEASRQQFAEARFERQWPELIRAAFTLLTGVVIAGLSRPIASRLVVNRKAG